ncbi:type II secretion system minor pseudopilin GspK [Roseateles sp. BYS180W]|uniref:Type II secretion system protein K n=1 Tax=Roseateles rivi TaxID=3299028 RepID=A0ABW7FRA2_9BURK
MMRAQTPPPRRQTGAALLLAMLIVTLVATMAGAMMWRQYRAVHIEAAERARAQAAWVLRGSLDWARMILREDALNNRRENMDHLGEVWAVPLAEARLSTFLAGPEANTEAGAPEAFLSGSIEDAQSRYNLRNLMAPGENAEQELRIFTRLCELAGLPGSLAQQVSTQLRATDISTPRPSGKGDTPAEATAPPASLETLRAAAQLNPEAPLLPQRLEQLRWLGAPEAQIRRLAAWVTLLPQATPVNINTAPREVLAALFEGMDLSSAERLVQTRLRQPFKNLEEVSALLPNITLKPERAAVNSSFFFVAGRLRLEQRVIEERSLIQRRNLDIVVVQRERISHAPHAP